MPKDLDMVFGADEVSVTQDEMRRNDAIDEMVVGYNDNLNPFDPSENYYDELPPTQENNEYFVFDSYSDLPDMDDIDEVLKGSIQAVEEEQNDAFRKELERETILKAQKAEQVQLNINNSQYAPTNYIAEILNSHLEPYDEQNPKAYEDRLRAGQLSLDELKYILSISENNVAAMEKSLVSSVTDKIEEYYRSNDGEFLAAQLEKDIKSGRFNEILANELQESYLIAAKTISSNRDWKGDQNLARFFSETTHAESARIKPILLNNSVLFGINTDNLIKRGEGDNQAQLNVDFLQQTAKAVIDHSSQDADKREKLLSSFYPGYKSGVNVFENINNNNNSELKWSDKEVQAKLSAYRIADKNKRDLEGHKYYNELEKARLAKAISENDVKFVDQFIANALSPKGTLRDIIVKNNGVAGFLGMPAIATAELYGYDEKNINSQADKSKIRSEGMVDKAIEDAKDDAKIKDYTTDKFFGTAAFDPGMDVVYRTKMGPDGQPVRVIKCDEFGRMVRDEKGDVVTEAVKEEIIKTRGLKNNGLSIPILFSDKASMVELPQRDDNGEVIKGKDGNPLTMKSETYQSESIYKEQDRVRLNAGSLNNLYKDLLTDNNGKFSPEEIRFALYKMVSEDALGTNVVNLSKNSQGEYDKTSARFIDLCNEEIKALNADNTREVSNDLKSFILDTVASKEYGMSKLKADINEKIQEIASDKQAIKAVIKNMENMQKLVDDFKSLPLSDEKNSFIKSLEQKFKDATSSNLPKDLLKSFIDSVMNNGKIDYSLIEKLDEAELKQEHKNIVIEILEKSRFDSEENILKQVDLYAKIAEMKEQVEAFKEFQNRCLYDRLSSKVENGSPVNFEALNVYIAEKLAKNDSHAFKMFALNYPMQSLGGEQKAGNNFFRSLAGVKDTMLKFETTGLNQKGLELASALSTLEILDDKNADKKRILNQSQLKKEDLEFIKENNLYSNSFYDKNITQATFFGGEKGINGNNNLSFPPNLTGDSNIGYLAGVTATKSVLEKYLKRLKELELDDTVNGTGLNTKTARNVYGDMVYQFNEGNKTLQEATKDDRPAAFMNKVAEINSGKHMKLEGKSFLDAFGALAITAVACPAALPIILILEKDHVSKWFGDNFSRKVAEDGLIKSVNKMFDKIDPGYWIGKGLDKCIKALPMDKDSWAMKNSGAISAAVGETISMAGCALMPATYPILAMKGARAVNKIGNIVGETITNPKVQRWIAQKLENNPITKFVGEKIEVILDLGDKAKDFTKKSIASAVRGVEDYKESLEKKNIATKALAKVVDVGIHASSYEAKQIMKGKITMSEKLVNASHFVSPVIDIYNKAKPYFGEVVDAVSNVAMDDYDNIYKAAKEVKNEAKNRAGSGIGM